MRFSWSKRRVPSARDEYVRHLPWRAPLSYMRHSRFLFFHDEYLTATQLSLCLAGCAFFLVSILPGHASRKQAGEPGVSGKAPASLAYPGEKHLKNIRQLTFGGESAEAY